jgi:hypothetical protein
MKPQLVDSKTLDLRNIPRFMLGHIVPNLCNNFLRIAAIAVVDCRLAFGDTVSTTSFREFCGA